MFLRRTKNRMNTIEKLFNSESGFMVVVTSKITKILPFSTFGFLSTFPKSHHMLNTGFKIFSGLSRICHLHCWSVLFTDCNFLWHLFHVLLLQDKLKKNV